MSKPGLSFGLNLGKKPGASKKGPPQRKTAFGGDDSDDDAPAKGNGAMAIGELDGFDTPPQQEEERTSRKSKISKNAPPTKPPTLKSKTGQATPAFGDLAGSLTSRKNAEAAEQLDPSVYDYDKVYDTFKPQSHKKEEAAADRKPRYMSSVLAAAAVRKRDALIAEEKKIAREREAEGDEFAGKEKFVTEAYKRQQEENRRLEAEEKAREEEEEKKNKAGGMNAFYKGMLQRGEERHKEMMEAAEALAKSGKIEDVQEEEEKKKDEDGDERARKINELGGSVAVNEEGQVVDKRQLLRGGLNIDARAEARVEREAAAARARKKEEEERRRKERAAEAAAGAFVGAGGKGAMRERQSRMLEAQLEAALKRTREEEEGQREEVERAAKSRKTEGEIMSAKERYLARKREAEEAKKKAAAS